MKVVNFGSGILFVFIISFMSLINPLILYSVKYNKKIDTESSYSNTQKHSKFSEKYLFTKALFSLCVSVFIPLLPVIASVPLLLVVCLF
jgi:hypothetical protein